MTKVGYPDYYMSLLKELNEAEHGSLYAGLTYGMSDEETKRRNSFKDMATHGHAEWSSDKEVLIRITLSGKLLLKEKEKEEKNSSKFSFKAFRFIKKFFAIFIGLGLAIKATEGYFLLAEKLELFTSYIGDKWRNRNS